MLITICGTLDSRASQERTTQHLQRHSQTLIMICGEADEDKVMKFVEEIAKAGYDQDQAMEILQTTLAEQPDYFNKKTPFERIRQTAANRGREF